MSVISASTAEPQGRSEASASGPPRQLVDVHCHCLPGLDDGPDCMAQSLQLCAALVADGVGTVIATPRQLGRYDRWCTAGRIRHAVAGLRRALAEEGIPLRITPGADIRLDDRLLEWIGTGEAMTLGDGGKYLLLDLPHDVPINPAALIRDLRGRGITVVVSHPERHECLAGRLDWVLQWLGEGVTLQITAGSLVGQFGRTAERIGWSLLERGWATVVASEAHDCVVRPPTLGMAMREISRRLGREFGEMVCMENPRRISAGCPVLGRVGACGVPEEGTARAG